MKVGGVVHTHGFNRGSNEHGSDMESGPSHPELTTIQYADASGIDDGRVMTVEYEQFYLVNVCKYEINFPVIILFYIIYHYFIARLISL
jgi:hypothetical protein